MLVSNQYHTSLAYNPQRQAIVVIDQTLLPHTFKTIALNTLDGIAEAITSMRIRGAPLIGIASAYALYFAINQDASNAAIGMAYQRLMRTRPTAINLKWALDKVMQSVSEKPLALRPDMALQTAEKLRDEDIQVCEAIGEKGLPLIANLYKEKNRPIQILTHCNAGWLATVDWGTALAPVYKAHQKKIPVHVWVDETRPRNQGYLTYWELSQTGVPCTLIVDNAGGHLMQKGQVDLCLVGADRIAKNGDVANKIGTYLKALAAFDNHIPFYVAAPTSSFDLTLSSGNSIPIEERAILEISHLNGVSSRNALETIRVTPENTNTTNPGFDVTPARLITGYITENGIKGGN